MPDRTTTRPSCTGCAAKSLDHANSGVHYHMAVKLERRRRWLHVHNYIDREYGIKVNFSGRHENYYTAWAYTTKEDISAVQSENHPDLGRIGAPITSNACSANRAGSKRKRKALSIFDVSQLAVEKGIKTRLELLAFANQQKQEGRTDLAEFIANRGGKAVEEALSVGWEMEKAEGELARSKMTRIELLYSELGKTCVEGCNGRWLTMAEQVLRRNEIDLDEFAGAVRVLLREGRGKYRNMLLTGVANCGKTFLLNLLNSVFKSFCNPATTTFAWVGTESAEVIFLNDFRWCPQIIPWHDLLLLLEGQKVHLPAPKTHFSQDVEFSRDTPIFCTSKEEFTFVRGGMLDQRETEMMRVRWKVFSFHAQIPEEEQQCVSPCPRCFAALIFSQT